MRKPYQKEHERAPYQERVTEWVDHCFGIETRQDLAERAARFLEEALELVQSLGMPEDDAMELVGYTFGRPQGQPVQELGGVMVTLAGLAEAAELNMVGAGETELIRCWIKTPEIRAKQATKPKTGPLPGVSRPLPAAAVHVPTWGMAWKMRPVGHTFVLQGETDGGAYPWDREHAFERVAQMNLIYGPGSHWVLGDGGRV